jgi:hypothetical protein
LDLAHTAAPVTSITTALSIKFPTTLAHISGSLGIIGNNEGDVLVVKVAYLGENISKGFAISPERSILFRIRSQYPAQEPHTVPRHDDSKSLLETEVQIRRKG